MTCLWGRGPEVADLAVGVPWELWRLWGWDWQFRSLSS